MSEAVDFVCTNFWRYAASEEFKIMLNGTYVKMLNYMRKHHIPEGWSTSDFNLMHLCNQDFMVKISITFGEHALTSACYTYLSSPIIALDGVRINKEEL